MKGATMSKKRMKQIVQGCGGIGHMATVSGSSPKVRVMTFKVNGKYELLTSTFTRSPKMKQLGKNKRTAVSFWDPKQGMLIVEGTVHVVKDEKAKKSFYRGNPDLKNYFSGSDDPNYTLLALRPKKASIMPHDGMESIVVKF